MEGSRHGNVVERMKGRTRMKEYIRNSNKKIIKMEIKIRNK
jgi:hypothetical protein